MRLIETKTLSASAATVQFTSIPQTYTDLVLFVSARHDFTNVAGTIAFNGVTTGFTYRGLTGDGVNAGSDTLARAYYASKSTWTANTFSSNIIYIPNYAGSTNKSFSMEQVAENNAADVDIAIRAGLWANTAAITSLSLDTSSNFVSGSLFSLYGITKGSDEIVTTS